MSAAALAALSAVIPLAWSGASRRSMVPSTRTRRLRGPGLIVAVPVVMVLGTGSVVLAAVTAMALIVRGPVRDGLDSRRSRLARGAAWPDTLELIAMAVGVGMPLERTLEFVEQCGPAAVGGIFAAAARSLDAGSSRREALQQLARDAGPPLASAVDVLLAAERNGAPVALVLDRLSAEANRSHRLAADARSRRAPVLMLAPLTLCSLPAVMIGTIAPFVLLTFGQTSI